MFRMLLDRIDEGIAHSLLKVQVAPQVQQAMQNQTPKALEVGRNDPCPCGSGKKYKRCHGA